MKICLIAKIQIKQKIYNIKLALYSLRLPWFLFANLLSLPLQSLHVFLELSSKKDLSKANAAVTALAESGTFGNFESFAPAGTVILYDRDNFSGSQQAMTKTVDNLKSIGFNDKT